MTRLLAFRQMRCLGSLGAARVCALAGSQRARAAAAQIRWKCSQSPPGGKPSKCGAKPHEESSPTALQFWTSRPTWRRATVNTLRCLVGCTLGDFSAMWFLQTCYPDLGMGLVMGISSTSMCPSEIAVTSH